MDNKEQIQAANAFVEWFNSQEISQSDALLVIQKVVAKILIRGTGDTITMRKNYDEYVLNLANECNDRAFNVLHGKKK